MCCSLHWHTLRLSLDPSTLQLKAHLFRLQHTKINTFIFFGSQTEICWTQVQQYQLDLGVTEFNRGYISPQLGSCRDFVRVRFGFLRGWRQLQVLKVSIAFVPLSSGNDITGVVSTCGYGVQLFIGEDVLISGVVGCYPSCRDKHTWEQSMEGVLSWTFTGSVKQTPQLLLLAPFRKCMLYAYDEINQDVDGLAEVFLTVPWAFWSVSSSIWIDINLQETQVISI